MRNITVDFSQRPPLISDKYAGEIGEHQAVTLNIIPETNMSDDTDIAFYYVLFKVEGGLVASRTFSQGEDISIALWGQLLEDRRLTFQLIGTNGLESIISKSPVLTLFIGDSLEGTVIGIDDNRDSLIAMIGAFNERLDEVEQDVIYKPETATDGDALIYNATEEKWDAESRVKNISGMTGNEIRAAWNRGDELKYVASGSLFESKIIKVRNYTSGTVQGVLVSYWWSDTTPAPESANREYIRNSFIPNASTSITNVTALTRYGITNDERVKLSGGAIESGNSSFVTGGQVYSEGYLKSIPTASTSTLGGVKVDGSTITISDGVISSQGSSGAIDITGMTGNEIRTAWTNNKVLKYNGDLITSCQDYTYESTSGVLVGHFHYAVVRSADQATFWFAFIPNTGTTITDVTSLNRVGLTAIERSTGTVIHGNGGFVKGGQVFDAIQTRFENLPVASTSQLGLVKVDGTSITINDGVISAQGGGGASDLLVNFTIDAENTVSTATSISSIMTAINNGTNVRCKVAKEDNLYYAMGKIDGYVNVEEEETSVTYLFFSFYEWDGESDPTPYMLSAIMGANEGEDDSWYYVPCDLNNADTSSY